MSWAAWTTYHYRIFVALMFSNLLYPMIPKPTHITSNTTSLIDNIFTNNVTCLSVNGPILNDLSDHLQFLFFQLAVETLIMTLFCSDWSKFDRCVHAGTFCSTLKLVFFDSWSWQSFVSTCNVCNCLFPLDVQNEIQLLSGVFCYSWLVCRLLVEKCVACRSRKFDFEWHRFRFSPCLMGKRV